MDNKISGPNLGVQLICYPDSLGQNLKELKKALDNNFSGFIRGVHILPFFPSSADRGFAPLTHRKINKKFGTAAGIRNISSDYSLMADLIVNHVSKESKYFHDYLAKGGRSKYHNFFIEARSFSRRLYKKPKSKFWQALFFIFGQAATIIKNLDFIFHKYGVSRLMLKKIYRPRPGSPFVKFRRADGSKRYV